MRTIQHGSFPWKGVVSIGTGLRRSKVDNRLNTAVIFATANLGVNVRH